MLVRGPRTREFCGSGYCFLCDKVRRGFHGIAYWSVGVFEMKRYMFGMDSSWNETSTGCETTGMTGVNMCGRLEERRGAGYIKRRPRGIDHITSLR